jgi:hypothetical protein
MGLEVEADDSRGAQLRRQRTRILVATLLVVSGCGSELAGLGLDGGGDSRSGIDTGADSATSDHDQPTDATIHDAEHDRRARDGTVEDRGFDDHTLRDVIDAPLDSNVGDTAPTDATFEHLGDAGDAGSDGGGIPVVTGVGRPNQIVLDSTSIYWTDALDRNVWKAPLLGGPSSILATDPAGAGAIVVDATSVYWSDGPYVLKVALDGGATTTLGTAAINAGALAVDSTNVYWTDEGSAVYGVPIDGGTRFTLATGQGECAGIAINSTTAFWANGGLSGSVASAPLAGGAPTTLSLQPNPIFLTIDSSFLYVNETGTWGSIVKIPLGGGAPITLVTSTYWPQGIAVDSSNVYWLSYLGGTVMSVPIDGGSPTTLATGQSVPQSIAVNESNIYWSTLNTIMRLPK